MLIITFRTNSCS